MSIQASSLPDDALLYSYRQNGSYTDCFAVDVAGAVSLEQFVTAFYTTFLLKLERGILKFAVSKPSTDAQAKQLASGAIDNFSAWFVEKRSLNQLLVSDYRKSTRSWFMVAPMTTDTGPGTRLYFGSAVVPVENRKTGKREMSFAFHALLGFHKLYSVLLLSAAEARLTKA